jgi:3-hydroxyisobutyrate dehydrogenase
MLKDLVLSQQAADAVGANTELGGHARDVYRRFVEAGGKGQDFSAILKALSEG